MTIPAIYRFVISFSAGSDCVIFGIDVGSSVGGADQDQWSATQGGV